MAGIVVFTICEVRNLGCKSEAQQKIPRPRNLDAEVYAKNLSHVGLISLLGSDWLYSASPRSISKMRQLGRLFSSSHRVLHLEDPLTHMPTTRETVTMYGDLVICRSGFTMSIHVRFALWLSHSYISSDPKMAIFWTHLRRSTGVKEAEPFTPSKPLSSARI